MKERQEMGKHFECNRQLLMQKEAPRRDIFKKPVLTVAKGVAREEAQAEET